MPELASPSRVLLECSKEDAPGTSAGPRDRGRLGALEARSTPTFGLVQQAWRSIDSAQLSYWDALIVAAAQRAGARYLLSEDFQPNHRYEEIQVLNPFEHSASNFAL